MRTPTIPLLMGLLTVAVGVVAGAGDLLPFHHLRPRRRYVLPPYDYVAPRLSDPARGTTFESVPITDVAPLSGGGPFFPGNAGQPGDPRPAPAAKSFVLDTSGVVVDHCSLTRASLSLTEDGQFTVGLRAVQRPFTPDGAAMPQVRFERNRFQVAVRVYGHWPIASDAAAAQATPVELFVIRLEPFWMERGTERDHAFRGKLEPWEARWFGAARRAVVELQYER